MDLPVLIEPTRDNQFRASLSQPLRLEALGSTKESALRNLQNLLALRLQQGTEIVPLHVGNGHRILNALAAIKPYSEDDPLIQRWIKAMAGYREQVENDPEYL